MPLKELKWVKLVRAKGRVYLYFDTGKSIDGKKVYVRLPNETDPAFFRTYATLLGHRNRGGPVNQIRIPKLIDLYQRSKAYDRLAVGSKRVYDINLRRLESLLPTAPVAEIERRDIMPLFDKLAKTPGAANLFLATTSALFKWAKSRDYVKSNPCDGIERFEMGEHMAWPDHVLAAALASSDDRVRLLTHLLFFTAQRIGDVLAMTWGDVRGDAITVRQQKTGKVLSIPFHSRLRDVLAKTPRRGLSIVTTDSGAPLSQDLARDKLKAFAKSAGFVGVPHGLRKNAVVTLLESGCSLAETASISGQSLKLVEYYASQINQGRMATAAILQWERNETGPCKQGKTTS